MAAASALQPDRHLLLLAGRHRPLLRVLPPRAPLRRPRWRVAGRVVPSGDGAGVGAGLASTVEVEAEALPVLMPVVVEELGGWGGGEGQEEDKEEAGGAARRPSWWEGLPERYKLIGATSLAFAICNMDKVNLSVAIIPMAHQYGWDSSTAGLVQSSFFLGFALSQLPGGWLAKLFGGRKVLVAGIVAWSLAISIIPFVAGFLPGLVLSRILVGIGEGLSPSSAADLIARFIPLQERSRAVSVVYDGSSFGSVLGLLFAPPIIQNLGWESAFYILGLLGIIWCLGFESLKEQKLGENEGTLNLGPSSAGSDGLISSAVSSKSSNSSLEDTQNSLKDVPWGAFFKSKAVWAMIYAHFCGSWGHYTCLSWLPTFFSQELNLSLAEAAWVSILPPLGSMVVTSIVAPFADNLISNGVDTTKVRKICQTISFVSPAIFLMLSSMDLGLPPWEIVAFLTIGLSLSNFALSGHGVKLTITFRIFVMVPGSKPNIFFDKQGFIVPIKISLVNMLAFSWESQPP
uniref:Major facilitator superfamily (MFS) profile domain-containing protein n=1 Tax=Setaria italica TaxID=4555 RepID=K3YRN9_SETIT